MIAIEELQHTVKRLELLRNNETIPEESFMATSVINTLKNIIPQLEELTKSPNFITLVKQYEDECMTNGGG